jgi:hypothetical protein
MPARLSQAAKKRQPSFSSTTRKFARGVASGLRWAAGFSQLRTNQKLAARNSARHERRLITGPFF